MAWSDKQREFLNEATHRWNIKSGATRSGKTYLDYFVIPKRIRAVSGNDGLCVMLGNTKTTLQRNLIEPLQNIWGNSLVSDIHSDNTAYMFGEKVHCIGADKVNQVNRLRGSSIKYCYGDEIVTWHKDVFEMLKSRLDKSYSKFDGTCNPENPNHWFKKFLDNENNTDIYLQEYTIFDNPFLSKEFVENLKKEYANSVYYDRYILGKWALAEGIIFRDFADNPQNYIIPFEQVPKRFKSSYAGYDLGGHNSAYALVSIGLGYDGVVYVQKAQKIKAGQLKTADVDSNAIEFINYVEGKYNTQIERCGVDDAYYTTINDLNAWRYMFYNAAEVKGSMPLYDRPMLLSKLMAQGKFKLVEGECNDLIEELKNMVYDDKAEKDVPLDDGTLQIDCYDGLFYALSPVYHYLKG